MLEVLAGMRRDRESRNETADPRRADYSSKAEDGWMSRKIGPRDAYRASGWESPREEAGGSRSDARAAEDNLSRKGYQSIDQTPSHSQAAADGDGWGNPSPQQQATSQSGNRTDTPRSVSGIHPGRLRLMGLSVPSSPAPTKPNEFRGHTEVASPEIRYERQWAPDKTSASPVQSLDQNPQAQDRPGDTRPRHRGDTRSSSGRTPWADRDAQSDSYSQSLSEDWGAPGGTVLSSSDRLQGQEQGHSGESPIWQVSWDMSARLMYQTSTNRRGIDKDPCSSPKNDNSAINKDTSRETWIADGVTAAWHRIRTARTDGVKL